MLTCELCGRLDDPATCRPLLVGGEVIGSVLAVHHVPAGGPGARRIDESVDRAAPVLGNLRNLAIAENRAATDALTGLANRHAIDDTIKRMVAQAGRAASPLRARRRPAAARRPGALRGQAQRPQPRRAGYRLGAAASPRRRRNSRSVRPGARPLRPSSATSRG